MGIKLVVRPATRAVAQQMCADHPHAQTLPNSTKYNMVAYVDGRVAGLASWGYGIRPRDTPRHLFGEAGCVEDYLELCRFFVYDWCPKYTASKFLAVTHRLLKRHTKLKWLYTYAAGFQGMVGYIYQASGYDYIGRQLCNGFLWFPERGLVHSIALWHRNKQISSADTALRRVKGLSDAGCRIWCGYNFRYIYWLCDPTERERLLTHAKFGLEPYPKEDALEIWTQGVDGDKRPVEPAFAKTIPIIKLPSRR